MCHPFSRVHTCGPHHLLAEPLELGSWDILGRGGWDATEGVLALVSEWLLQVYQLFLTMEVEGMRRDPKCSVSGFLGDETYTFWFYFLWVFFFLKQSFTI